MGGRSTEEAIEEDGPMWNAEIQCPYLLKALQPVQCAVSPHSVTHRRGKESSGEGRPSDGPHGCAVWDFRKDQPKQ